MLNKPFATLYEEVVRTQQEGSTLEYHTFISKPERLLILRLALNVDQRRFATMLGISQGTVWNIERGGRKHLSKKVIVKVRHLVTSKSIQIPTVDILSKRHLEITRRGRFAGEYARKMANKAVSSGSALKSAIRKDPTHQEDSLIEELSRQKILFQFHGVIGTTRKFVVDFVFPSDRSPKIALEVKDLRLDYRKRLQAIDLAYRALKIRQSNPKIKLVAVVDGKLQNDALSIIKEEYDNVLQNPSSKEVAKTIKGLSGSTM